MEEKKELLDLIRDVGAPFGLPLDLSMRLATAILSAGYIKKSDIEKLIPGKMLDYATPDPDYSEGYINGYSACRDEILENLKDIIK